MSDRPEPAVVLGRLLVVAEFFPAESGASGGMRDNPEHLRQLEDWLRSYRPEELLDQGGAIVPELARLGQRRMTANPHSNGGQLLKPLLLPDFREYAVPVDATSKTILLQSAAGRGRTDSGSANGELACRPRC